MKLLPVSVPVATVLAGDDVNVVTSAISTIRTVNFVIVIVQEPAKKCVTSTVENVAAVKVTPDDDVLSVRLATMDFQTVDRANVTKRAQ